MPKHKASQFSHLLRMNSSLWLPSRPQQVNAEVTKWVAGRHVASAIRVTQAGCGAWEQSFSTLGAHWNPLGA